MVMNRDQVFISYSRKDSEWLEKLKTILAPLERKGKLNLWTDANIQPGKLWKEEIQQALVRAKVAVLLVSPDFLASDFIDKHELPLLLEAAKKEELIILWVLIKPCLYQETEIANYQAAYDLDKPLSQLEPHCREAALITIAKKISEATQIRDVSEEQQERLSKPQSICKNIPGQNPLDAIEEKKRDLIC